MGPVRQSDEDIDARSSIPLASERMTINHLPSVEVHKHGNISLKAPWSRLSNRVSIVTTRSLLASTNLHRLRPFLRFLQANYPEHERFCTNKNMPVIDSLVTGSRLPR